MTSWGPFSVNCSRCARYSLVEQGICALVLPNGLLGRVLLYTQRRCDLCTWLHCIGQVLATVILQLDVLPDPGQVGTVWMVPNPRQTASMHSHCYSAESCGQEALQVGSL